MRTVIANAAFLVNLAGLVIAGYFADTVAPFLTVFLAAWFVIGAYTAGLYAFGGGK